MSSNLDDYGSVSIETAANDVGKIFIWALIIKMFVSIFSWLWYAISALAKTIYNLFIGSDGLGTSGMTTLPGT